MRIFERKNRPPTTPQLPQEREARPETPEAAFRAALPELIAAAQLARDTAVSYRGFLVGCSVFAWHTGERQYKSYSAGNHRPEKGDSPPRGVAKRCAERNAIDQALADGAQMIIGLVTVSTETHTGDESHGHSVLHPCEDCRELIATTPQITEKAIFHGVHDHKGEQPGETVIITQEEKPIREVLVSAK
jgi:cytidine deaminase